MHSSERKVRAIIASEVARASGAVLSWAGTDRLGEAVIARADSVVRVIFVRRARRHDIPALVGRVRRAMDQSSKKKSKWSEFRTV